MAKKSANLDPWQSGYPHLVQAHPRWQELIGQFGPCPLRSAPVEHRFDHLVSSIISQQISTKAADAIQARLSSVYGSPFQPQIALGIDDDHYRAMGLSQAKLTYVRNLARAVQEGQVDLVNIHNLDDAGVSAQLTSVKGIGVWTADMFLIFCLCRPDILPVGDLGIRMGLRDFLELPDLPNPREFANLTNSWRPFRTLGMWYLWRLKDSQSKTKKEKSSIC